LLTIGVAFLLLTSITGYGFISTLGKAPASDATLTCAGSHCNLNVPIHVNLALNITVYKSATNRTVVGSVYQPHDLILNNFYDWLIAALNNAQSLATIQTSGMKNTAGSAVNPYIWGSHLCSTDCFDMVAPGQGGLIEVGTVSTAATRTDTNLGAAYQSYFDTSDICSIGSTDSVVVTGSENANSGTTITESGLFYQSIVSTNSVVMFAHDVFSGVVVSGGNTITVQYTWSLNNAGFNYNLCELLAAYFTQPNGAANNGRTPNALMIFYDTSGRNVTWSPNCPSSGSAYAGVFQPLSSSNPTTSACGAFVSGDTNNAMQIEVGTGSSAFTPTSRSVTTPYASNFITNTNYDSAGNAFETANILLVTGATISEAAIYLTLPKGCIGYSPTDGGAGGSCHTSYGSDTIMLLAATFSGQAVPNGASIGITFQESG
jgi:hypothetical protein